MKQAKITVIGSVNMDLVTITKKRPNQGETVLGESFQTIPGGKGANQAVAAARLGADVALIGRVGDDSFGQKLKTHLQSEGVRISEEATVIGKSTGIAAITISEQNNSIIVVPGANGDLTKEFVESHEHRISTSDLIVVQLEIPLETVIFAIELASKHHVPVILNPAPVQPLTKSVLEKVTYLTPNEHEVKELNIEGFEQKVIITQGNKGVIYYENGIEQVVPSFSVDVIDTTGAGDAFNAALAVSLAEGKELKDALRYGCAVGALAVTKLGAQSGMPTKEDIEHFLKAR
ncbi:ribokinase [Bacillus suaedae]|uniref:Ribokinase n=1 Tax=Halalkalibacter suaedae TaxID=2822140 RepID=A0A940WU41_9BACI|nr:ribokinase [Bacillus suaedae]